MNKQTMVYSFSGMLLCNKRNELLLYSNNMHCARHNDENKVKDTKEQISFV